MKVFLVIVGVCLLGAFTCWKSVVSSDSVADDFFLKNVEALADEEFFPPLTLCEGSGSFSCPGTGVKVAVVYEGLGLQPDEETY
ncbi:MAG: hypothetical protein IKY99_09555 [Bacteroidaceae bacterium]|nr:hypothetical protein [Bacteroidaceae bacterium]